MRRMTLLGLVTLILLGLHGIAHAVGGCAIYKSFNTGDTFTANDATQIQVTLGQTNMVLSCIDDYSSSATQMQSTVDPYPSSVVSLATTAQGEIERIRYVIKALTGWSQWYTHTETPTFAGTAPSSATYITQTVNATLTAEQSLGALTTGLTLNTVTGSTGVLTAYGGTSCTNQFPRSLNASGAATCASVANADLAGSIDLATKVTGILPTTSHPALTGDVTTSSGAVATTLASIVSAAGPIGSATVAPIITIDAKGRVTALSSATITAGVALGDTPTWTGAHTFSYVGPAIKLTGSEAQLFVGSSTDPGWGSTAFAVQFGNGAGGAVYTQGSGRLRFVQNVYYDGSGEKYILTDTATQMNFNAGATTIQWAASGTAGTAITWTDEVVVNANGTIHGAPTGGAKGTGTINATAVYDDNTLLTDWAFDLYYDGKVREGDRFYRGQRLYPFAEALRVSRDERRLPWMPTRETFEAERSLGGMVSRLWFGQEQQQMYLFDQAREIKALRDEVTALKRAPGGRR